MEKRPAKPTPGAKPAETKQPPSKPLATQKPAPAARPGAAAPSSTVKPVPAPAAKKVNMEQTAAFHDTASDNQAADFLLEEARKPAGRRPNDEVQQNDDETHEELPADEVEDEESSADDQERTQHFEQPDEDRSSAADDTQFADESGQADPQDQTAIHDDEAEAETPVPAPAPKPAAVEKNVVGDYRLIKKLGQGGMGTVYKAHQISLDRPVALKVLSPEAAKRNPNLVERFKREARVMAKLDHPNILRCFEVNEFRGVHYLTMEFVEGGSVQDWLGKLERFSVGDALHITLASARALQHAHDLNMIHRDIKPENILLTAKGVVKVADLGLAKAQDEKLDLTRTGTGAGTPVYMAPEQAKDVKHVDHRSDIYSLGCMLFTLLSGEPPFKGETLIELFEAKHKGAHRNSRDANPDVPGRLDLIIDKMLAVKPEHRYQSCNDVIAAVEELELAGERLSFLAAPEDSANKKKAVAPTRQPASTAKAAAPSKTASGKSSAPRPSFRDEEATEDIWYVKLEDDDGGISTKRMDVDKLIGMIKNGMVTAKTQASRSYKEGFRNLATYNEFTSLLQAQAITRKADKKGEKFRTLYAKIEKEEERRHRRRWLHNLYLSMGGFVGLLIWFIILGGLAIGAIFLINNGFFTLFRRASGA
jgi:serine/threonine-protein kinase